MLAWHNAFEHTELYRQSEPTRGALILARRSVVIVGGGAVGLCAAYFLSVAGADVTIVERDRVGSGASHGNAGWIVPSLSAPLPAPGLVRKTFQMVGRPNSPVFIKPQLDLRLLGWLWRFWRSCNRRTHLAGLDAVATLNLPTMDLFDRLADDGVAFRMYSDGLIWAFLHSRAADAELEELQALRPYGYKVPDAPLRGHQLRTIEPALSRAVQAGFFLEGERHIEPETLIVGLSSRLRDLGVRILEDTAVTGFQVAGPQVTHVNTTSGSLAVGHVLIAAGAWSSQLTRLLGRHIPLAGGKGYSFSVTPDRKPRHPLYLSEAKVACSPIAGHLRIAGIMELSGLNLRLDERAFDAMLRGLQPYLADSPITMAYNRWAGLRPVTPDGLPVLDRLHPLDNVYISTGHSMLGITLAPASGIAMAEFIQTGRRPQVLRPFSVARL